MTEQDKFLFSLTIWREARNSQAGMLAVAWVMFNRLNTKRWGLTMTDVVTARLQFSSMTALGDPETVLWPNSYCLPGDLTAWQYAQSCCARVMTADPATDPTRGGLFYFAKTIAKPPWASTMILTATIGNQEFYTEAV